MSTLGNRSFLSLNSSRWHVLFVVVTLFFVLIPKGHAKAALDSTDQGQRRYVLITRQSLSAGFQRLVDRRASQGFDAVLVTVEQIEQDFDGRDIQEKIRNCIHTFYEPSVLLFVALGGDADLNSTSGSVIPVRYCHPRGADIEPADIYYADMDGGAWDTDGDGLYGEPGDITLTELTPDVCLGRIPVRTAEQARDYIDKVIIYEEAPLEGFANSLIFVCGTNWKLQDLTGNDRPSDFRDHDPVTTKEVSETRFYMNEVQPFWQAVPLDLFFNTRGPQDQYFCGDFDLNRENLIEQLSEGNEGRGYHIIRHIGHGNCSTMGIGRESSAFKASHISQLTNDIPGFMISSCCGVAGFDKCEPCIGEAFVRNPNGGTIAFFGPARSSGHNEIAFELLEQVFKPEGLYLGQIMMLAQTAGVPGYVDDPYKPYIYTFLGDPAIKRLGLESERKVQVYQPGGCEVIDVGDDITIRWNAVGTDFDPSEKVKLEYSDNSGRAWFPIPGAEELPYDGRSFIWRNCPLPEGIHYRIRVSSLSHPNVRHYSRRDFSIVNLGMLTVMSYPHTGVQIDGTHKNVTEYNCSMSSGQAVSLAAPEQSGGLEFRGWLDPFGNLLSAEPGWQFEFAGDTTIIASYGFPTRTHYYVNDDEPEGDFMAGNDLNDGLSPHSPRRHIEALLSGDPNIGAGDTIHLSAGVYEENITLGPGNSGLTIVGAGSGLTEINGGPNAACININQCGPVTLKGLCFTQGHRGIYCDGSICMISDCEFFNNSTNERGGGLWSNGSRAILSRCEFAANRAKRGGAVLLKYNNEILMSGCRFEGNSSSKQGGGFYIRENNNLRITNCTLAGNTGSIGGGLYILDRSSININNSTFEGNTASSGSAVYVTSDDNSSNVLLKNCILWDTGPNPLTGPGGLKVEYSDIQRGWSGEGNIEADPRFARPGYWDNGIWIDGDYHLKSCVGRWNPAVADWVVDDEHSPCIDAGSGDSDWTKEIWPQGERINMGAYGGTSEASMSDIIEQ